MSTRLKIGSYVIDAAETGSTSNTPGCLLMLRDGPRARYSGDQSRQEIPFLVQVTGSTPAEKKARLDALLAVVTQTVNTDLVLEYASGMELTGWKVSTAAYSRITCRVEVDEGELIALVVLVFTAERLGAPSGSAGDVAGALIPVEWNIGPDSNGKLSLQGTCIFQKKSQATAWVQSIRAGAGRPDFCSPNFRYITAGYGPNQQLNQGSPVPDAAYTPTQATVLLRCISEAFAAITQLVDIEYERDATPRPPLPDELGQDPGWDVTVTGNFQVKLESDGVFDSADTEKLSKAAIAPLVEQVRAAVKADAEACYGKEIRVMDFKWGMAGTRGEVNFALFGVADLGATGILRMVETVELLRTTRNKRLGGTLGPQVFKHADGPAWQVKHTLTIEALSLPEYRPLPYINPETWDEDVFVPAKPSIGRTTTGERTFTCTWSGAWTRVAEDPGLDGVHDYDQIAAGV